MRTGWISSAGRFIDEFEQRGPPIAAGAYGVAVSNGTTALQIAVACLDLAARRRSDHADVHDHLVRARRSSTTAAIPVLVDSDPRDVVHGRRRRSSERSPRARGRSCRCTSTAIRWTWIPCLDLAESTVWRSSKTRPKLTAPSICRESTEYDPSGGGAAASATSAASASTRTS